MKKTVFLALSTVALLILTAALAASRWALRYRAPCTQACQNLGKEPVPGRAPKDSRTYAPKCAPLELELELAEPKTRIHRGYTLWYRIRLTNVSCYELGVISAMPFVESKPYDELKLLVLDPAGQEVKDRRYSMGPEYGEIIPFTDDPAAFKRFLTDSDLKMDSNGFVTLPPGKSMTTAASILQPHTRQLATVRGEGWVGSAFQRVPASARGIPAPPAGYRILDLYELKKPGRYTIRAIYDHPGVFARSIYPYAHRVPEPLKKLSLALRVIQEADLYPDYRNSGRYPVRVESPAIEFEVEP